MRRAPTLPPVRPLARAPWLALLLVLVGACAGAPPAADAPRELPPLELVVLHTNDVHGQVLPHVDRGLPCVDGGDPGGAPRPPRQIGGLERLARHVARERAGLRPGQELLVLDAGDWFQGTPEGLVEQGAAFTAALADVGYDAMCVGNHELDHGVDVLVRILADVAPPAVLANVLDPATGRPVAWAAPYRLVERGGWRIALVGLLSVDTPDITHPDARGLVFQDPVAALRRVRDELAGRVDLVLPVTHVAVPEDRRLARAFPDLPLVVGGHSHTRLPEGLLEGTTLIVQAGAKARELGRVELSLRPDGSVERASARLIELADVADERWHDAAVAERCDALVRRSEAAMSVVVGTLASEARRGRGLVSGSAGNLLTDLMREATRSEVALQNRGGIRSDLEPGPVTRRQVFEILPFGNTVVVVELTGARLVETVRRAVEGTAHSGIELSGAVARVRLEGGAPRLVGLDVGGGPVEPERRYRVATNSFLARGGDRYLDVGEDGVLVDTGTLLREVLEAGLSRGEPLRAPAENRYVVETPAPVGGGVPAGASEGGR